MHNRDVNTIYRKHMISKDFNMHYKILQTILIKKIEEHNTPTLQ